MRSLVSLYVEYNFPPFRKSSDDVVDRNRLCRPIVRICIIKYLFHVRWDKSVEVFIPSLTSLSMIKTLAESMPSKSFKSEQEGNPLSCRSHPLQDGSNCWVTSEFTWLPSLLTGWNPVFLAHSLVKSLIENEGLTSLMLHARHH